MRLAPPPHRGFCRHQSGLTLIELIVAIAVLAIIVTIGIPGFQKFTARNEVAAEVMRIKSALANTRSAAITRRTTVTLCPTVDMAQCQITNNAEGDAWRANLAIFEGQGDPGDPLLRTFGESRLPSLTYRNDNLPVRYSALGRAGGHFGTFRICGKFDEGARVIINIMGRVRVDSSSSEC